MRFRNYCVIIMGNTDNVKAEVLKVAETEPNILDANGIVIATFTSAFEPREMTDYFKEHKRNFMFFDMNIENSGYHITKKNINDGLFGFLKDMNEDALNDKRDRLIQEISSSTVSNNVQRKNKKTNPDQYISLEEIDHMSANDKNNLMNKILAKDVRNLSDYDKEILNKLSI